MHIGIYGTGQLARMMAHDGKKLGATFSFIAEPNDDVSAIKGLGEQVMFSGNESADDIYKALGEPEVITVEKEAVDVPLLRELQKRCRVSPNPDVLEITQHRLREKNFLNKIGIPTAGYAEANSAADVKKAIENLGIPVAVKSIEQGYDGKNQWHLKTEQDVEKFLETYNNSPLIIEQWVPFEAEVSLIAARSLAGDIAFYAMAHNEHRGGILISSIVPAKNYQEKFTKRAQEYLSKILTESNYVGVLSMECFVKGDELLVNELAPRVHNSGHWSQAGTTCSQFENAIRAVMGIELGNTELKGPTAMLNLLGKEVAKSDITIPGAQLHWYDKQCKPKRKVGHINFQHDDYAELEKHLAALEKQVYQDD